MYIVKGVTIFILLVGLVSRLDAFNITNPDFNAPCVGPGNTSGFENPCGVCCFGDTNVNCLTGMDCFGVCGGNAVSFTGEVEDPFLDIGIFDNSSNCEICKDPEENPVFDSLVDTSCDNYLFAIAQNFGDFENTTGGLSKRITLLDAGLGYASSPFYTGFVLILCKQPAEAITDCNGDCEGTAIIDDCGVCAGGNTNNTPNVDKDCNGVCDGPATADCAGVCEGNATLNECGSCVRPDNYPPCNETCANITCGTTQAEVVLCISLIFQCNILCNFPLIVQDCNGDCGGTAFTNDCGFCVEGNTNRTSDFGIDCNGDCNGTAAIDDCGVCAGGNTLEIPNEDKDCAGICFGDTTVDPCGICGGNSTTGDCCNCPRSAGYWKTHNCFSRSKNYRDNGSSKRLRREWPGQYAGCEEETCSKRWVDVLWTPAKGDAWNILARQYIAAQLNLEAIPCFIDEAARTQVEGWIADAKTILESNCADGLPKGTVDREAALALSNLLETFNTKSDTTLLTGNCYDANPDNDGPDTNEEAEQQFPGDRKRRNLHHNLHKLDRVQRLDMTKRIDTSCFEASLIQQAVMPTAENADQLEVQGILPGEPPLQCVGGFTLDSLYYQHHNGELGHPQTKEEWLGGSNLELCTICGIELFNLITDANNLPFAENDTWLFTAHEWVAAVINVKNGACLTQVTADALFDGLELLENSCTMGRKRSHNEEHDFVPLDTELGQAFMEVHDQLESFNNEEWGPWENLLDILNEECDDDDDTETGYIIWGSIMTVLFVIAIVIIMVMMIYISQMMNKISQRKKKTREKQ